MKKHFSPSRWLILFLSLILALQASCIAVSEAEAPPALSEGAAIRVMSYNIMHPDWSRVPVAGRDEKVAVVLQAFRPDVVALQEAGAKWHKALGPLLVETGLYAPACRKSNADGFTYCTTCFLYNPETLRLVEEAVLDLEFRHATRVFSVAVFETVQGGVRFVVANTHPSPTEEADKYRKNMAGVTTYAMQTMEKYPGLPLVVAGDFNTPEQSDQYAAFLLDTGLSDAKYEAELLARSCSTYFGFPNLLDPQSSDACIDHLFVNGAVSVKLFDEVIGFGVQEASDHIPIYADLGFLPQ